MNIKILFSFFLLALLFSCSVQQKKAGSSLDEVLISAKNDILTNMRRIPDIHPQIDSSKLKLAKADLSKKTYVISASPSLFTNLSLEKLSEAASKSVTIVVPYMYQNELQAVVEYKLVGTQWKVNELDNPVYHSNLKSFLSNENIFKQNIATVNNKINYILNNAPIIIRFPDDYKIVYTTNPVLTILKNNKLKSMEWYHTMKPYISTLKQFGIWSNASDQLGNAFQFDPSTMGLNEIMQGVQLDTLQVR